MCWPAQVGRKQLRYPNHTDSKGKADNDVHRSISGLNLRLDGDSEQRLVNEIAPIQTLV